jgi:DNA-binding winged helix-turn-helix (wHTH) protein/tetratricopeptide (TPR) repeat protein
MPVPGAGSHVVRFGVFELDAQSSELHRNGMKVRLADQPVQILKVLLEHPGELVTREHLRQRLWTSDTYVAFDLGLNSAVRKLREALGDSADNPRFIETLPRRGYRFIAPIASAGGKERQSEVSEGSTARNPGVRDKWTVTAAIIVLAVAALGIGYERVWRARPGDQVSGGVAAMRVNSAPAGAATPGPRHAADVRAVDPAAYNLFINGVEATGRETYQQFRDAIAYFEQAVARQPNFAEAHAAIAQTQLQFLFTGPLSPREVIPKAEAEARKAIELDETLAQPHRTLGLILQRFYWKWEEGDRELRRARELNAVPNDAEEIPTLIRTGRVDEAIAEAERGRTRDVRSFDVYLNLALAYQAKGDFDRARAEIQRGVELRPDLPRGYFQLGATLVLMGRPRDAIPALEKAVNSSSIHNPRFQAYLGYAFAASGRHADARRILASLDARAQQQYVSSFGVSLIYDALGEKGAALSAFQRAFEERALEFSQAAQYPSFRTIASEPRFLERMQAIGLPR